MKKYKVIKPFFKLSEQKNYSIGDTIELSDLDAKAMDLDAKAMDLDAKAMDIYVKEIKKEVKK